jgi:hypothetical protein
MPGHVHYKVGAVEEVRRSLKTFISTDDFKSGPRKDSPEETSATADVLERILSAVPPRSITGKRKHRQVLLFLFLTVCRCVR